MGRWADYKISRIWLLEFARKYPQAVQLEGLDISLDQIPPKDWLPSNVSFSRYDVYEDPPKNLVEKFDIVHVRHLAVVIKQNDPTTVLHNLLRMLSKFRSTACLAICFVNDCLFLSFHSTLTHSAIHRAWWLSAMGGI